jgi:hypothetical protein
VRDTLEDGVRPLSSAWRSYMDRTFFSCCLLSSHITFVLPLQQPVLSFRSYAGNSKIIFFLFRSLRYFSLKSRMLDTYLFTNANDSSVSHH